MKKRPMDTAPKKGKFLVPVGDEWVEVERYDCPLKGIENAVRQQVGGKWWRPAGWQPLPGSLTPCENEI